MYFKCKPNEVILMDGEAIGQANDKGILTIEPKTILSPFIKRMKNAGRKELKGYMCKKCGQLFEDKGKLMAHSKTCGKGQDDGSGSV